jgi:hypothetical protein
MGLNWGILYTFIFTFMVGLNGQAFTYVTVGITSLLIGLVGSGLLKRYRRPVPRWTLAVMAGSLAGTFVGMTALNRLYQAVAGMWGGAQVPAWLNWGLGAVWGTTHALLLAGAQGLALWGRRWPPTALIWIPGAVALAIVGTAVAAVYQDLVPFVPDMSGGLQWSFGLRLAGQGLLAGAIEGAGTAWLLDRCEFKRPETPTP